MIRHFPFLFHSLFAFCIQEVESNRHILRASKHHLCGNGNLSLDQAREMMKKCSSEHLSWVNLWDVFVVCLREKAALLKRKLYLSLRPSIHRCSVYSFHLWLRSLSRWAKRLLVCLVSYSQNATCSAHFCLPFYLYSKCHLNSLLKDWMMASMLQEEISIVCCFQTVL